MIICIQEYFIRRQDGCSLNTHSERQKLAQCLIAAIERRESHVSVLEQNKKTCLVLVVEIVCFSDLFHLMQGLRLDICTQNKMGLLSDVMRVFRENGLSITRVESGTQEERATRTFYVTDASGHTADLRTVELESKRLGDLF